MLYLFALFLFIADNSLFAISIFTQFKLTDVLFGVTIGVAFFLIGVGFYNNNRSWKESMLFLVGGGLQEGGILRLVCLSLIAGVFEEIPTRFLVLFIYLKLNLQELSINDFILPLVFLILINNAIWTIFHIANKKNDYKEDKHKTLKKSLPHLFMIFSSGLVMYYLTLSTLSVYPAMIAHFLLNFSMGIYVRRRISS